MAAANDKTLWNEANKQLWREQGRMLTVLGHRLFVRDDGAADQPTILLIHGFPTSSWDWQGLWEGLRPDYRLITLDMLGFGFSDKPKRRDYSIHLQADLVEAVLSELGV